MFAGLAGAVLAFSAIWHLSEWFMSTRNKDTLSLIPFGVLYGVLSYLIVNVIGGNLVLLIALIAVLIGLSLAIWVRKTVAIRAWVMWVFIAIDVVVAVCLILALLG